VKLETGKEAGSDLSLADLKAKYGAVFLGVGLGATPALGIPGEEKSSTGWKYIEQSKLDAQAGGRRQCGGGRGRKYRDRLRDHCQTAGCAERDMVYRRSEKEMTRTHTNMISSKREGVNFFVLTQPVRVISGQREGDLIAVRANEPGAADASGRPSPQPVTGSEFLLPADQVVKAIGQAEAIAGFAAKAQNRKGIYPSRRRFRNQSSGSLRRRRLHSRARRSLDRDGGAGRKTRGASDS